MYGRRTYVMLFLRVRWCMMKRAADAASFKISRDDVAAGRASPAAYLKKLNSQLYAATPSAAW